MDSLREKAGSEPPRKWNPCLPPRRFEKERFGSSGQWHWGQEFKQAVKDIEKKFWDQHNKLRLELEEKGLL